MSDNTKKPGDCSTGLVSGERSGRSRLQDRAKVKFMSYPASVSLVEEAKWQGSKLEKGLRSVLYCNDIVEVEEDGRASSRYCRKRSCTVCARILTGEAIHRYMPVIETWADVHFVTLTSPNCSGDNLRSTLGEMQKGWTRIRERMRYRGIPLIGVRKLEVTFNPVRRDFHPHYHVLTGTGDQGRALVEQWLREFPAAKSVAQDCRKANPDSLLEVFKYATKTVQVVDNRREYVPAYARLVIWEALHNKRLISPIGFKLPKEDQERDYDPVYLDEFMGRRVVALWRQRKADWYDMETGDALSGYDPTKEDRDLADSGSSRRRQMVLKTSR